MNKDALPCLKCLLFYFRHFCFQIIKKGEFHGENTFSKCAHRFKILCDKTSCFLLYNNVLDQHRLSAALFKDHGCKPD